MPTDPAKRSRAIYDRNSNKVRLDMIHNTCGAITYDHLICLSVQEIESLSVHCKNVRKLIRQHYAKEWPESKLQHVLEVKPTPTHVLEVKPTPTHVLEVKPTPVLEVKPTPVLEIEPHVPKIEEESKIELKEYDVAFFDKSVEDLIDIVVGKEDVFKSQYGYMVAAKILSKAKRAVFEKDVQVAHRYLSTFMNALFMSKFEELGEDKYKHIKMRWNGSNAIREDFIADVCLFKTQDAVIKHPIKVQKYNRIDDLTNDSKVLTINSIGSFLFKVQKQWNRDYEGKLTRYFKTKAKKELRLIEILITEIKNKYECQFEEHNVAHQNIKAKLDTIINEMSEACLMD
jgi:hypothetical protein